MEIDLVAKLIFRFVVLVALFWGLIGLGRIVKGVLSRVNGMSGFAVSFVVLFLLIGLLMGSMGWLCVWCLTF